MVIKTCPICGREFFARKNGKFCSPDCRKVHKSKRRSECNREYYIHNNQKYRDANKKWYREHHEARLAYRRQYQKFGRNGSNCELLFPAELEYWNYLIQKYPGGAICK